VAFKEIPDDDGFPSENLEDLTRWIKITFREAIKMPQFNIEAVNFTTYGAGLVNLGENGKPVTPLYNYLNRIQRICLRNSFQNMATRINSSRKLPVKFLDSLIQDCSYTG
jgi:sugar (pentulose or hexulose) kinase